MPNITGGILGAAFIAVALVLGEYVFASLLHFDTLPVAMAALYKSNGPAAMAAALASMLFVSVLLVGLTFLSRDRHRARSLLMTDLGPSAVSPSSCPTSPASTARCRALDGLDPAHRARRARRPARPVGLRQDDGAAHPGRPRPGHVGHGVGGRQGPDQGAGQQARHGDGVPGLQPVPAHDGHRQRRLRPQAARARRRRAPHAGRRHARPGRPRRARRPLRPPALRRPAAARRAGPGAGDRAVGAAARRAAVGPRRQGARAAARRDPPGPARGRHHDAVRHPRPGGGARRRRPGRRDERRSPRAARAAGRALLRPGHAGSSASSSASATGCRPTSATGSPSVLAARCPVLPGSTTGPGHALVRPESVSVVADAAGHGDRRRR